VRIELRQIGVRDEAKRMGGYGCCGRKLCCTTFLKEFEPITTQSAKEQNLPLNPQKLSGLCGRLLCCILYEHEFYQQQTARMPSLHSKLQTPRGVGEVIDVNVFTEMVTLQLPENKFEKYALEEIGSFKRVE
jgi:cell fate regulator YaaT (PSP1 superfamily)